MEGNGRFKGGSGQDREGGAGKRTVVGGGRDLEGMGGKEGEREVTVTMLPLPKCYQRLDTHDFFCLSFLFHCSSHSVNNPRAFLYQDIALLLLGSRPCIFFFFFF